MGSAMKRPQLTLVSSSLASIPKDSSKIAQLRVVRFKGTSVTHPVIDRLDCSGALWEMVNAAEEFIRKKYSAPESSDFKEFPTRR